MDEVGRAIELEGVEVGEDRAEAQLVVPLRCRGRAGLELERRNAVALLEEMNQRVGYLVELLVGHR